MASSIGTPNLVDDDTARALPLLPLVRRSLQLRDMDAARAHFLQLPALETRHAEWLEACVRDGYAAGLFDVNAVLSFFENLPNWHWTLDGCALLHRVNATLATGSVHMVHVPALPLAYFLHKLLNHLDGSAKVRAEAYWYEWVSPTMRAVVTGQPVLIESLARRETLYAPASKFAFDFDRRNVFSWRALWTSDGERKEQWRLVPANAARDRFYLQSVQFGEFLYAADYAKFGRDDRGKLRSRVFTWRKKDDNVGDAGHWQLIPQDPHARDVFALYNPYQKEYLYSPRDIYDRERRHVFTAAPTPLDPAWEEERRWRVTPLASSAMELGIEAFFRKQYPDAVTLFTKALDELPDHTEHVKCYVYRMASNLRMGRTELLQQDFDKIEETGGDKAAIFHGLHHLWAETAAVLHVESETIDTTGLLSIDHYLQRGDQAFVAKDYATALAAYEAAATLLEGTHDPALRGKHATAKLASAKCHFATHDTEKALSLLDELLAASEEGIHLPVELEARVLLWSGRCRRQQKRYEDALRLQERALDKLASSTTNHSPTTQWIRHCILIEMQVVGIHHKELLSELLERSDRAASLLPSQQDPSDPRAVDKTVRQMIDLFHCPLSLEPMQDPVMTPNGDTYEREMIERHLEVNGQFDPMTRAPLTKAQLYPNRALKMLMETLLCEHRLGLLLLASGSE
jgi:tetratricopeptide (TPR) repeat protein